MPMGEQQVPPAEPVSTATGALEREQAGQAAALESQEQQGMGGSAADATAAQPGKGGGTAGGEASFGRLTSGEVGSQDQGRSAADLDGAEQTCQQSFGESAREAEQAAGTAEGCSSDGTSAVEGQAAAGEQAAEGAPEEGAGGAEQAEEVQENAGKENSEESGGAIKAYLPGSSGQEAAEEPSEQGEEEEEEEEEGEEEEEEGSKQPQVGLIASTFTRGSGRRRTKLTFTGPPKCLDGRSRTAIRSNYSHSQQRVRQILRDNDALVRRLGQISYQSPEHEKSQQKHDEYMTNTAASSEKRRAAEAKKIMKQNLRIYQRLQEVKPSRDVARTSLDKDFAKHERMLASLAALHGKKQGGWAK